MISVKKALCVLGFGLGFGFSMNSYAVKPDCALCAAFQEQCEAGDSMSCRRFDNLNCFNVLFFCP